MEKKQGFFAALKEEVARGLSPGRSRRSKAAEMEAAPSRSGVGVFLGGGEALAPLMEGPDPGLSERGGGEKKEGWGRWVRGQLSRTQTMSNGAVGPRRSDLRLLLGVMGAPLAPVHVCAAEPLPHLSVKDTPIETSSAQYILQQYIAASGGQKLLSLIKNSYAMGKVRMVATEFETANKVIKNRHPAKSSEAGRFVLWQMAPEMWYIELALGGSKVHAGCNGRLVWRHTPWLGAHAAKGPVRPLRRAIQYRIHLPYAMLVSLHGMRMSSPIAVENIINASDTLYPIGLLERYATLSVINASCDAFFALSDTSLSHWFVGKGLDPLTTASMFSESRCIGERKINGEDCFILKLCTDPETLKLRSEGPAEIIRHVLFGYFSQRTGLLIHLEDSHLTRIQSTTGGDAIYWETTINSFIDEYRPVEGAMVAHSGRSAVTLFRFGESAMSHTKTRMEEAWSIEEVAFNVPGLSIDCFIPPNDLKCGSVGETLDFNPGERNKMGLTLGPTSRAKVAAASDGSDGGVGWKVQV